MLVFHTCKKFHVFIYLYSSQWKANNRNSPTRSNCSGSRIRSGSLSYGNTRFNQKPFGVADFGDSQDDGTDARTRSMSSSVHDLRFNAMRTQQLPPFGYFVPQHHHHQQHVNKKTNQTRFLFLVQFFFDNREPLIFSPFSHFETDAAAIEWK